MTEYVKTVVTKNGVETIPMTQEEILEFQQTAADQALAAAQYVPPEIAMWQVRTVLHEQGLFDQAQAVVQASNNYALTAIWEYGNFARRDSPAINQLGAALNLSSEDIDQLFRDAFNLVV